MKQAVHWRNRFMTTRIQHYIAVGVTAAALAAGTQTLLFAQDQPTPGRRPGFGGPPPGGGPGPGMRMRGPGGPGFPGLDLTDEQKAQITQIHESHADEFKAARDKVQAAHAGMGKLLDADTIAESAIRAKSAEIAAADAELIILNAKVRKASEQVLTAEQLAQLKQRREDGPGPRMRRPQ
jgi:Spy/CpxP family protein refolding chaperone